MALIHLEGRNFLRTRLDGSSEVWKEAFISQPKVKLRRVRRNVRCRSQKEELQQSDTCSL